ncbi:MAG: ferredoxin family protein [Planctomycetota bacterium]|nr:ferredoxin family protein [Planctomycetota bacterium]
MTHVVAEPCIECKHTDCVTVCPVDCFHEGENFLAIDPDECIDCGACVPQCPVDAIFPEFELPERWSEYLELNERLSQVWPVLSTKKDALAGAASWGSVQSKREQLSEAPGPGTEA